jgi:hypothetical protein
LPAQNRHFTVITINNIQYGNKSIQNSFYPSECKLAVLPGGDENIPGGLSPEEQLLWNNRPEKNAPVLIQRLPNMLFLVKPDLSKPHFQVLETYRKAGAKCMETVKTEKIKELTIAGFTEDAYLLAFTEGLLMAGYSFHKYKKEKDDFMPAELNIFHDRSFSGSTR